MLRRGKLFKADKTGDSCIAEYEPGVSDARSAITQKAIGDFWDECIEKYHVTPDVWGRRVDAPEESPFVAFDPHVDQVHEFQGLMIQDPQVAG